MAAKRASHPPTPFTQLCAQRGLLSPSAFLPAFADVAREIGESTTVTARQFQRWRLPRPPCPRPAHLRVLHALFGVPPQDMGFPVPTEARATGGSAGLNLDNVDRREFFAAGAAASATAFGLVAGENVTPPLTAGAPVGAAHVRELRSALANLYALDDAFGGTDVRPLAVRLLRRIRRVINTCTYPDTIGRQLHLTAGLTAEQCGWLCFDAGRQHDARRFWGEALTTAAVLHDEALEVAALSSMALQALYEHRPREAYDLARAAQERATRWSCPPVVSLLAAREALALAGMRDQAGARRALARSMHLMEQSSNGPPVPEWAAFHGPAELSNSQGRLYTEAGHYKAAVPYLQAALSQQRSSYVRNRFLYRLRLADALIRSGDIERGCAEVIDTVGDVEEIGSGRARRQIKNIQQLLASVDAAEAHRTADQLRQMTQLSRYPE